MHTSKILCIVGTRPEAIKMAPVIAALRRQPWAEVKVVATAQHREMLDATLAIFGITPDIDLDLMQPNQRLAALTARLFQSLDPVLEQEQPALVLAQGDTTTVMVAAVACFYRRIPFGHVEAGLRTGDLDNPFPEEFNRKVAALVTRLHFAPTARARDHLLAEGLPAATVHVTGNTVIDALLEVAARPQAVTLPVADHSRMILVTAHRRENFGRPLEEVFGAIADIVDSHPNVEVLYPVHPNPNVREPAQRLLGGRERIHLVPPLDYLTLAAALKRAELVITDSGGLQEEAPALGKPVLVLRRETERPEAMDLGVAKLVGSDRKRIVAEACRLLDDPDAYRAMAKGVSPYGDGHAAERISTLIRQMFYGDGGGR